MNAMQLLTNFMKYKVQIQSENYVNSCVNYDSFYVSVNYSFLYHTRIISADLRLRAVLTWKHDRR